MNANDWNTTATITSMVSAVPLTWWSSKHARGSWHALRAPWWVYAASWLCFAKALLSLFRVVLWWVIPLQSPLFNATRAPLGLLGGVGLSITGVWLLRGNRRAWTPWLLSTLILVGLEIRDIHQATMRGISSSDFLPSLLVCLELMCLGMACRQVSKAQPLQ